MNPQPLSLWDRVQLLLLRSLSRALAVIDGLFRVDWGERLLERLAGRWQTQLDQIDQALAELEKERQQLRLQAEALAIQSAILYVGGRLLTGQGLRFDPADPREEELLNAAIDLLVKDRLAAIDMIEIEPERYVYDLEPDWTAIRLRLTEAADRAEPQTADWFREGLGFIDTVLTSETGRPLE